MSNGVQPPNYTQIPNALLGDLKKGNVTEPGLMSKMTGSELKVYLAVCRLTFGFHQLQRRASIKMIMEFTGMAKQSVYNAAEKLEDKGLIERQKDGGVTLWKAIVYYLDPPTSDNYGKLESKNKTEESKNKTPNGLKNRPPSKKETIKKPVKEKIPLHIQMFDALRELCGYDSDIYPRGKLNQNERKLREAGISPGDLQEFSRWWYSNDWRGQKGQPPQPHQVVETWGQYKANGGKQNGTSRNDQRATGAGKPGATSQAKRARYNHHQNEADRRASIITIGDD